MPRSPPTLSIVIPAHNESLRLPRTLADLRAFVATDPAISLKSVIIVDDGSTDDTTHVALSYSAVLPIEVLRIAHRPGVGPIVRAGILKASGDRILVCDADGAVPFSELPQLWASLDAGADVAIGSRRLSSHSITAQQPVLRRVAGRIWGKLVRWLAPLPVYDTQCGFKLFTHSAAQRVFAGLLSRSFAFYIEVLLEAQRRGLRIHEHPVRWAHQPHSKINLAVDSAAMACDLVRLALRSALRHDKGEPHDTRLRRSRSPRFGHFWPRHARKRRQDYSHPGPV